MLQRHTDLGLMHANAIDFHLPCSVQQVKISLSRHLTTARTAHSIHQLLNNATCAALAEKQLRTCTIYTCTMQ